MISKTWSRKPIAACVAVAILSVYSMVVLASPAAKAPSAELSVLGQVTVNGESAFSGGTLFSDSMIATAEKSSATVNLSKLGRVEVAPSTGLKLSFTEKSVLGMLQNGTAHVSTLPGIAVNFTTADGNVAVDGSQPTSFTVNVVEGVTSLTTHSGVAQLNVNGTVRNIAAGETGTGSKPAPQDTDDDDGDTPGEDDDDLSGGETLALIAVGAGAIAAIIYAVTHDNDLNFGGTVVVVSPTK
jgi:hypothetical protein